MDENAEYCAIVAFTKDNDPMDLPFWMPCPEPPEEEVENG